VGSAFVVIVNYRTAPMVVDCLASLAAEAAALRGGKAVVVDNASADGSASMIHEAIVANGWQGWAEAFEMPENGGFAYGTNAGIARAREIDPTLFAIVVLNPDTLVRPGAISTLVAFLHANSRIGIAGASIERPGGAVEISAHRDPSPLGELDSAARLGLISRWLGRRVISGSEPRQCDWVSGACMAVRRETLDAAGPFDEGFFLYFEEVDFCARARRLGWTCWYVPGARVVHYEGASTGIRVPRRRRPAYWFDSRRRFFVKRYGIRGLLAADLLWAIGRLSLVLRRLLGLGGRAGAGEEPERLSRDLLIGDMRALITGTLRRIPRDA
jgi:hypothetical protein